MGPRYRHVIWDWNGTLVDDALLSIETINRMLALRRLPLLDLERYRRVFDFPIRDYYVRIGFDLDAESFEHAAHEFVEQFNARWHTAPLRSGAREVLSTLSARGVCHSVLSATERSVLRRQCEHHGMQHAIATWVGLDDRLAHSKVGAGRRWLDAQELRPVDVVLVGDTVHDHEVAQQLGVDCMLVEGGHQDAGRLRATGARVCRDLTEVRVAISGA